MKPLSELPAGVILLNNDHLLALLEKARQEPIPTFVGYADLDKMGVMTSRMMLKRAIEVEGFPPGRMVMPNSRRWTTVEVLQWLIDRPAAKKEPSYMPPKGPRARVSAGAQPAAA